MPAQPTVVVRVRSAVQDLPQYFDRSFGLLFGYLGQHGEAPAGAPVAVYHNFDMQNLDLEISVPVARPLPGQGEVQASELPARRVATGLLTGPYEALPDFYRALNAWCAEQNLHAGPPAYETYLNNPAETPPDQYQTRVELTLRDEA
jgi:effector-binding domain-containing protein